MITSIKLKNFQSHTDTVLDLSPGINIITGPSDVGKSAIIRAMKWVALNRPAGDHIRRHKTKKTEVTIDGVTKIRTVAKHEYHHNSKTYKALRTNVPPEIEKALRLAECNFQEQHDAYFLIADSPGQVAKTLNQVADLQIIDLSLQAIKQRIREAKTTRKYLDVELEKQKLKVEELSWALDADQDYKVIEEREAKGKAIDVIGISSKIDTVKQLQKKFSDIPAVEEDLVSLTRSKESLNVDLSLAELIRKVKENQVDIPDPYPDLQLINPLINKLNIDTETIYQKIHKVRFNSADLANYPETIDDIQPVILRLSQLQADIDQLTEMITEVVVAEDCLEEAESVLRERKDEYDAWLKEVEVCPLCSNKL